MNLTDILVNVIAYEETVRDHYARAGKIAQMELVETVLSALATDEQGHIDFLRFQSEQVKKEGHFHESSPEQSVEILEWMVHGRQKLVNLVFKPIYETEIQLLQDALKLEYMTTDHYRRLAVGLTGKDAEIFAKFLKIENNHTEIIEEVIARLEQRK